MLVFLFFASSPIERDLNSYIQSSRRHRANSMMVSTTNATPIYPPLYASQSEVGFYTGVQQPQPASAQLIRSLTPDHLQKMRYKIDLGEGKKNNNESCSFDCCIIDAPTTSVCRVVAFFLLQTNKWLKNENDALVNGKQRLNTTENM